MRLIDADELEAALLILIKKKRGKKIRQTIMLLFALDIIRNTDTVEKVSVKHGKWCETHNIFQPLYCNACRKCAIDITPYCPNCGAKMNGDDEEK